MLELNKIYNMDCVQGMKLLDDCSVDLTVTSPPYDNLRTYNGNIEQWSFEKFQAIAKELYRVTKQGGVVVWVVGDATIKGSETGTSFRQALYFKEIGFNLHDTMIWKKTNPFNFGSNYCYTQCFEYMFVFSKGKPKTINLIHDRPLKNPGMKFRQTRRSDDDFMEYDDKIVTLKKVGRRLNVWEMPVQSIRWHSAIFPEQLAEDHILSWSNEGDLVLDPMCGSGTTCKMAKLNGRNYIGIDIAEEYVEMARRRVEEVATCQQLW